MTFTFLYKGFAVEIGELPEPGLNYWKILQGPIGMDEPPRHVHCWTADDLKLIAMRSIDQLIIDSAQN